MKNVTDVKLKEGETLILLKERVYVYTTESNPHAKPGTKLNVHPLVAEKGVKDGFFKYVKEK